MQKNNSNKIVFTLSMLAIIGIVLFIGIKMDNTVRTVGGNGLPYPSSITATSLTVTTATTSVYTATANLQRLLITNLGPGTIYCAFGTNSVLKNGMVISPFTSSSQTYQDIQDAALLNKPMNCIATANSSTSILKY